MNSTIRKPLLVVFLERDDAEGIGYICIKRKYDHLSKDTLGEWMRKIQYFFSEELQSILKSFNTNKGKHIGFSMWMYFSIQPFAFWSQHSNHLVDYME